MKLLRTFEKRFYGDYMDQKKSDKVREEVLIRSNGDHRFLEAAESVERQ